MQQGDELPSALPKGVAPESLHTGLRGCWETC